MNKKSLVAAALAAMFIAVSCSKKEDTNNPETPDTPVDNKVCTLSRIIYPVGLSPYNRDNAILTFDSAGRFASYTAPGIYYQYSYESDRILCQAYNGSTSNEMLFLRVYMLDDKKQVDYSNISYYSQDRLTFVDSIDYQYDADGYMVKRSTYQGSSKVEEFTYTYADGNLLEKKRTTGVVEDTWKYTYDTSAWQPAARYLYEVSEDIDIQIGKPNKNNIAGIDCINYYGERGEFGDFHKTINYTYVIKDNKLSRINMKGITYRGINIDTYFGFSYNCK